MELETLYVELQLIDKASKELDQKLAAYEKKLNSIGRLSVEVDDSALTALNKHLDLKAKHVREIQSEWDRKPLKIRVDDSELDKLKNLDDYSVGKGGSSSSSSETSTDSSKSGENKLLGAVLKPFDDIFTGLFERVGTSVTDLVVNSVTKGLKKHGIDVSGLDTIVDDFLKDFFKDVKEEARRETQRSVPKALKAVQVESETKPQEELQVPFEIKEKVAVYQENTGKAIVQSVTKSFKEIHKVVESTSPDINTAKNEFSKIREGFKKSYASLTKALRDDNLDLAEAYLETINKLAEISRENITNIQKTLKAQGVNNKFGSELATLTGSTKGNVTRYQNQANRNVNKYRNQSVDVGKEVIGGVVEGLKGNSKVEQESAQVAYSIIYAFKDILEIHSPSKVTTGIGQNVIEGLIKGLKNKSGNGKLFKQLASSAGQTNKYMKMLFDAPIPTDPYKEGFEAAEKAFKFGAKAFKKTVLKGYSDIEAGEIQNEIIAMMFSGGTLAMPELPILVSLAPIAMEALPTIFTVGGLVNFLQPVVNRAIEAIKIVEPLQKRLSVLGGSDEAGTEEFNYANRVASEFNISKESALNQYSQLAIAARGTQLEGLKVRKLFEGISASVKALELNTYDTSLVFNAYTQILAKGRISMEELRQQLGEKFPPAMGIFAEAMGVSVAEMNELIERGAAISEDILPQVADVLLKDFGGAARQSSNNFSSAIISIENQAFDLSVKLSDTFKTMFTGVANVVSGLVGLIDSNFESILNVGTAVTIGLGAQLVVGLQQMFKVPALTRYIDEINGLIMGTFTRSFSALTPFFVGVLFDAVDGILGVENSVFDNLVEGFQNITVALLYSLNDVGREFGDNFLRSMFSGEGMESFINGLKTVKNIIQSIPSGIVEFVTMFTIFEQMAVLMKMYLVPAFGGLQRAIGGLGKAFVGAVTSGKNLRGILRILIADSAMAKGAMIAFSLAVKGVATLLMLSFANGDFINPLLKDLAESRGRIINLFKELQNNLTNIQVKLSVDTTELETLELKSKGLELNPLKILSISEDSFKSDDFAKHVNKVFGSRPEAGLTGPEAEATSKIKARADAAGVGEFFSGKEKRILRAQRDILNNAEDLVEQGKLLEKQLDVLGLSENKIKGLFSLDDSLESRYKNVLGLIQQFQTERDSSGIGKKESELLDKTISKLEASGVSMSQALGLKNALDTVGDIDEKLENLGRERSSLALINDTESKNRIKEIDSELKGLLRTREEKIQPVSEILLNVDSLKAELEAIEKTIDSSDIPEQVKESYKKILQPQKDMIDDVISYLKSKNLYELLEPLENVWQKVIDRLHDVELEFNKTIDELKSKKIQGEIQLLDTSVGGTNLDIQKRNLNRSDLESNREELERVLAARTRALEELLTIAEVETNPNRKEKVKELRDSVKSNQEALDDVNLELAQLSFNERNDFKELSEKSEELSEKIVKQQDDRVKELNDIIKSVDKLNKENEKKANELKDGYGDFIRELNRTVLELTEEVDEVRDEAKGVKIDNQLFSNLTLGVQSLGKELLGEFSSLFGSLSDFELDKKDDALERLEIEEKTLEVAKRIREFTEQRQDFEEQLIEQQDEVNSKHREYIKKQVETWNDIVKQFKEIEKQANEMGVSIDSVGKGITREGDGLIRALSLLSKRLEEKANSVVPTNISGESNFGSDPVFPLSGRNMKNTLISSDFGWRKIFGRRDFHEGLDFAVPGGSEVIASRSGKVGAIKPLADQMQVMIESINEAGQRVQEWYIHLGQNLDVKLGQQVGAGERIGEVAHTTSKATAARVSTGDHLDYRAKVDGKWVNPRTLLSDVESIPTARMPGTSGGASFSGKSSANVAGSAKLTPEQAAKVIQVANKVGMSPEQLLTIMLFETGGTLNPGIVNQIGASGLIQFMPATAKELGTDIGTVRNMGFEQQMDLVGKYFQKRGFKPGMPGIAAYSTVLAGGPNEKYWNRRDANGTNARSGYEKMMRDHNPIAKKLLAGFIGERSIPKPITKTNPVDTDVPRATSALTQLEPIKLDLDLNQANASADEIISKMRERIEANNELSGEQTIQRQREALERLASFTNRIKTDGEGLSTQYRGLSESVRDVIEANATGTTSVTDRVKVRVRELSEEFRNQREELEQFIKTNQTQVTDADTVVANLRNQLPQLQGSVRAEAEKTLAAYQQEVNKRKELINLAQNQIGLLNDNVGLAQHIAREEIKREVRNTEINLLEDNRIELLSKELDMLELINQDSFNPDLAAKKVELELLEEEAKFRKTILDLQERLNSGEIQQGAYTQLVNEATQQFKLAEELIKKESAFSLQQQREELQTAETGRFKEIENQIKHAQVELQKARSELIYDPQVISSSYELERLEQQAELEARINEILKDRNLSEESKQALINKQNTLQALQEEISIEQELTELKERKREAERAYNDLTVNSQANLFQALSEQPGINRFESAAFAAEGAKLQQELAYTNQLADLEDMITKLGIGSVEAQRLRDNLAQINDIRLEQIREQANLLGSEIRDGIQSSLQSAIGSFARAETTIGESLKNFAVGVLETFANLAAEIAAQGIISGVMGWFGGGSAGPGNQGGGGIGGFLGDAISSLIPIANNGLRVQNFNTGGIVGAMGRERSAGGNPVPIVASVGEQILATKNGDAQMYRSLKTRGVWGDLKRGRINTNGMSSVNNQVTNNNYQVSSPITVISPEPQKYRQTQQQIANEQERLLRRQHRRFS